MPVTSDRDKVRLLVGDTVESDPLLYDDEIDACLSQRSVITTTGGTVYNVPAAAADCAGAIAAKYAREFNFAEDGQRFDRAQRVSHYTALQQDLRRRQGGFSAAIANGGTITTT